jgi:zinc transporter ZupT
MAIAISLVHFLGEKISSNLRKYHDHLESFGAGIMVGIIFLELLPQIAIGEEYLQEFIYIPFLFGFIIIALVEKFIYRRIIKNQLQAYQESLEFVKLEEEVEKNENQEVINAIMEKDFECIIPEQNALFEGVAFVTHGFVIGILITLIFETNWNLAFIVIIPFYIRAFTISFSAEQILDEISDTKEKIIRILSFVAPVVGAIIGIILLLNKIIFYIVFALSLGIILYVVTRDMIPLGKKGKPLFFSLGAIIALGIFLIFKLLLL